MNQVNPAIEIAPSRDAEAEFDFATERYSMEHRKPQWPLTILMPYGQMPPPVPVVSSLLFYAKHLDIGFDFQGHTYISEARNMLAQRFLAGKAQWSLWLDSDVLLPIGNANSFVALTGMTRGQAFAQHNTITRLLSHKQPLVGGVYTGKGKGQPLMIQPELNARNPNDQRIAASIREGKSGGGLQPVDWLAGGLMLVHRSVYEKIAQTQPVKGIEPYPYFTRYDGSSDDLAFCFRAKKAGFQTMLDTEVRAGHIGLNVFLPEDSRMTTKDK